MSPLKGDVMATLRVLNKYSDWTPATLNENQNACLAALKKFFNL